MKLYIYDIENGDLEDNPIIVDTIESDSMSDCESLANTFFVDGDRYAWSYSCHHQAIFTPDSPERYCGNCGVGV